MSFNLFIDPGHGPGDGCSGNGVDEYRYVWDLAYTFMCRASAVFEWNVALSRSANDDPSQQDRDVLAREFGADIIMSLHCDSGKDPRWHGATVFHVSTNSGTRQVADEIACAMPSELWSGSRGRARTVPVPDPSYERATYVVCRYTPPTILVETGFLSNPKDTSYMTKEWSPERITTALMAGACKGAEIYGN